MGIPHSLFEEKLGQLKAERGVQLDTDLTASDLKDLVEQYKNVYVEFQGEKFPTGMNRHILKTNLLLISRFGIWFKREMGRTDKTS